MAYQSMWYFSELPKTIIGEIEKDLTQFDAVVDASHLMGDVVDENKRKSKNAWIPSNHWSAGMLWHYVNKANNENFRYDITSFDGQNLQYTHYEMSEFYGWHNDAGVSTLYKPKAFSNIDSGAQVQDFLNINCEYVRKLSVILQLSDPEDYEGGNVQMMDESGNPYIIPRQRGTVVIFDSRTQHQVLPVTSGIRKSLVGWIVGPRWK